MPILEGSTPHGYYQFIGAHTLKLGVHQYQWEFIPTSPNYIFVGKNTGTIEIKGIATNFDGVIKIIELTNYQTNQENAGELSLAAATVTKIINQLAIVGYSFEIIPIELTEYYFSFKVIISNDTDYITNDLKLIFLEDNSVGGKKIFIEIPEKFYYD